MADVGVTISGVDELIRKLGALEGTRVLEAPMHEAVDLLKNQMQIYPSKRQVYPGWVRGQGWADEHGRVHERTSQNLQGHWTTKFERFSDGLRGLVGNAVTYARWVQSEADQNRRLAARGWDKHTDEYVLNRYKDRIIRNFQDAIDRAVRGI